MSNIRKFERGVLSTLNTTTAPLTAGSTFVGTGEINDWEDVMVQIKTDQNGTFYCEFSPDGTNWDTSLSFVYDTSRINAPHKFIKGYRYWRARFTNTSASDQTYFRLYTYFGQFDTLTAPLDGVLAENFDSISTRPSDYKHEVATGTRQGREIWNKFGYNEDIDVGTEVIASWGGTFTPLTTATTLTISSTSVNDTSGGTGCNSIVIYGIDANRQEAIEVVTMNGTTPIVTTSTWLGINRAAMFLCGSGQINDGTIEIDAVTDASVMAQMPSNNGVTQQCIFHVPENFNFVTEWLYINVLNQGKNAELRIKLWVYSAVSNGKQEVFRTDIDTQVLNLIDLEPNLPFPITEKTVMWLECTSNKAGVVVNARFSGILERIT